MVSQKTSPRLQSTGVVDTVCQNPMCTHPKLNWMVFSEQSQETYHMKSDFLYNWLKASLGWGYKWRPDIWNLTARFVFWS